MRKLKVMTIVGTRPEIIRLSRLIPKLDQFCDHVLVHTGQNYDYELNGVFFSDLGIRKPDLFLKLLLKSELFFSSLHLLQVFVSIFSIVFK